jgi:hypothetical protein
MNEIFHAFNLPVIPVNWNNGFWLSANLWDTFDYTKILIRDVPCIIARPLGNAPPVDTLLGQFSKVRMEEDVPIVLHLNSMTEKRRKELLGAQIPFVSPGQIYLPFLGQQYQQNLRNNSFTVQFHLTPLSQQLLFLLFYRAGERFGIDTLTKQLDAGSSSIAPAIVQLQNLGFVEADESMDDVVINHSMSRRALYVLAKPHLANPVRSIRYTADSERVSSLPLAGETALSEYSMLAPPWVRSVAYDGAEDDFPGTSELQDRNRQVRIEYWSYSPAMLSGKIGVADVLSVVSSLIGFATEEDDPRLDKALDEAVDEALGAA